MSSTVTNSASNRTGSATYSCSNGTVSQQAGASCSVTTSNLQSVTMINREVGNTCALSSGSVRCWGRNNLGQLGDGTTSTRTTAVQALTLTSGVTSVVTNSDHSCAIQNGAAKCWGNNRTGQLGDGTTINRSTPTQVVGLTSGVTAIFVGQSINDSNTCAIHNGSLKCWGHNALGQVGDGTTTNRLIPTQVVGLTSGVTSVSVGNQHVCAIHNGAAKCWGNNASGELGDGTKVRRLTPTQAVGLSSGQREIKLARPLNCSLSTTGALACWRLVNTIQPATTPAIVPTLNSGVSSFDNFSSHTCVIQNGSAKCFGESGNGQLGNGSETSGEVTVPVQVQGLTSGVTAISVGALTSCAIHNGSAKCWGNNIRGQVGNGNTTRQTTPAQVVGLTSNVTSIITRGLSTCAIHNGEAKCWGRNDSANIGDGTTTDRSSPRQVMFTAP